ncbi:MAG: bifunctional DNA-binding transcriptional regulator/O6-methylguanine-DNA methyltransferase Ada, partial [Bryobacteraceae bacterium]
ETREDAEQAGFRPCKRCRPDQTSLAEENAGKVFSACRFIEDAEQEPRLAQLALRAGLSPHYFQRVFKSITGLTPKQYAAAHREKRVRSELHNGHTVTQAIYDAGYNSNGRFYASSDKVLGMTPSNYRRGDAGANVRFAVGECSLGSILVARSERGVCSIALGDDPDALVRDLQHRFPRASLTGPDAEFEQLVSKVVSLVDEPRLGVSLPLDIRGTAFQQQVWRVLREIPVGATMSYAEIARRIGAPKSVRAVGQACGANSLAVAIPCHRAVRIDGQLGGYRWGIERKRALLDREARAGTKARR